MTVDLAGLLGQAGSPGADGHWVGPLPAETARRLACDAAVTRVLVTRHPAEATSSPHHHPDPDPARDDGDGDPPGILAARLQAALALLPPALGGPATQP